MGSKPRKNNQAARRPDDWHTIQVSDVLKHLNVKDRGLASEDASRRLAHYGPNRLLDEPRQNFLVEIWRQLNDPAGVISSLISIIMISMGNYIEAGFILFIIILYAVIGIIARRRATATSGTRDRRVAPEARVLRDGRTQIIPTEYLVPGDMVLLEVGDTIPADIRLIKTVNLRVNESVLTGVENPVQKHAAAVLDNDIPLTGQKNTAFMGSVIIEGWGHGPVIRTGMHTQLGSNMQTLRSAESENTPLQHRMDRLGQGLLSGALILVVVLAIVDLTTNTQLVGLFKSPQLYIQEYSPELVNIFILMASLCLAVTPLGIQSAGTMSLLVGIREMLRRHIQVQHLESVEKLSTTTTICLGKSDLLVGKERVARLWVDGQFFDVESDDNSLAGDFQIDGRAIDIKNYPAAMTLLWLAVLNSSVQMDVDGRENEEIQNIGDSSESAFLIAAAKAGASPMEIRQAYPRVAEEILDTERKLKITVSSVMKPRDQDSPVLNNKMGNWNVVAVKGTAEELLSLCDRYQLMNDIPSPDSDSSLMEDRSSSLVNYQIMTDENVDLDRNLQKRIMNAYEEMTKADLQVVGLAYRVENSQTSEIPLTNDIGKELIFVGLIGLSSEPRPEVIRAIQVARRAGIRTTLMTDESPNTTRSISAASKLLRPGHKIFTGMEMDRIGDEHFLLAMEDTDLFTRVSLDQKQRILDALKANGEVVAMISNSLEDTSVINRADIRIVDGIRGSKFPAGLAEIVIQQDIFTAIVAAIEQSRISLGNIHKLVFFLVSSHLAKAAVIFLAAILGFPLPFTIIQLLWMNLMNLPPTMALALDKCDPDIMSLKPYEPGNPLIPRALGFRILIRVFMQVIVTWAAFMLGGNFIYSGFQPAWQATNLVAGSALAFITLALSDLFCAYTARSEWRAIFYIGIFSNRYLQYAVELSIGLLLCVSLIPFFQPIFQTRLLTLSQWGFAISLALIPALVEEITKLYLRRTRPNPT